MTEEFSPEALSIRSAARSFRISPGIGMLVAAEILLLGFAAVAVITRSWPEIAIPALLSLAALLPALVEARFGAWFPAWMHGFYLGFLLAGPFAGGRLGFYTLWDPWDKVIHASSGLLVGFAVIFALGVIGRRYFIVFPPFLLAAGVLATGGFIAAAWEIAEYASDHLLGTRAQNASLENTMADIIFGVAGSAVAAVLMIAHHRGRRVAVVDSLLRSRDFASAAPDVQKRTPPAEPPGTDAGED